MSKTYVYDGQEAKLTGRVALKKARDSRLIKSKNRPKVVEIEILPDPNAADSKPWKKWVKEEELYEIEGPDPELLEEHPTPPPNERLEE